MTDQIIINNAQREKAKSDRNFPSGENYQYGRQNHDY